MQATRSLTRKRSRAGSAIIAALFVVAVIAVMSTAYLQMSLSKNREYKSSIDAKRALYIAEAGLSESFLGLVAGKSGNVGSDALPAKFADGVFWVTVGEAGEGKLTLTSTGLCGEGRSAVSIVVEKANDSVAALGVFADETLTIEEGVLIDSFDSREGSYEAQLAAAGGALPPDSRVGCNSDVTVNGTRVSHTTINGDVRPGPGGSVIQSGNATIAGTTAPRNATVELPLIDVPVLQSQGSIKQVNILIPLTIQAGDHAYTSLRVGAGAKAIVKGPGTLVVDTLQLDDGSTFTLDGTNGQVKVYVKDYVNCASGSHLLTTTRTPNDSALLINASENIDRTGDRIADPAASIASSGKFYGTIYAPNTALILKPTFEVYGALCAQSVTVTAGSKVHFDTALKAATAMQTGMPTMSCWHIVELPAMPLTQSHIDPLVQLKLAGITPVEAKLAHYAIGDVPPSNLGEVPFTGGLPGADAIPPVDPIALDSSPGTVAALSLINQQPPLATDDLKDALEALGTLTDTALTELLRKRAALDGSDLRDVLIDNSPLKYDNLKSVASGVTPLQSSYLRDVLIANSPLPATVLGILTTTNPPPLSPSHLAAVLAEQALHVAHLR